MPDADDGRPSFAEVVKAAGVPTVNLSLSVAGQATGLQGAEAIIVQASAATTIGLVPGTPTPETPATPPAG